MQKTKMEPKSTHAIDDYEVSRVCVFVYRLEISLIFNDFSFSRQSTFGSWDPISTWKNQPLKMKHFIVHGVCTHWVYLSLDDRVLYYCSSIRVPRLVSHMQPLTTRNNSTTPTNFPRNRINYSQLRRPSRLIPKSNHA